MPRLEAHPLVFAATEAAAQNPVTALVVWETEGGFHFRTVPACSKAVLVGLTGMLTDALAKLTEEAEEAEEDGG